MTFLMMLSVILLSMLIMLLSTLSLIRHLICGNNKRHCGLGQEVAVDFNAGKTQLVSFDWSNNTWAIGVKMDESGLEEKSSAWVVFLF